MTPHYCKYNTIYDSLSTGPIFNHAYAYFFLLTCSLLVFLRTGIQTETYMDAFKKKNKA